MTAFVNKKIASIESLGEKLRQHREQRGVSIEKAARIININAAYLRVLENDDYENMPANIYTVNFIKRYATFLNLNPDTVVFLHQKEKRIYKKTHLVKKKKRFYRPVTGFISFVLNPRTIKVTALLAIVALFLTYVTISINNIFTPPELVIREPLQHNLITDQRNVDLIGVTENEVDVTINGKPILSDRSGQFSVSLDLQKGLNIITITAKKKHSKPNTVYRQIIVTDPPEEPATLTSNN